MDSKKYSILIIDDHPLIIDAYRSALNYYSKHNESIIFLVNTAQDCYSGFELINDLSSKMKHIDFVF